MKMTNAAYDFIIIEDIIRASIRIGSINPHKARKLAMILDLCQSFNQEAIVSKNMKTNEIINGKGTIAVIFGTHLSFDSLSM